MAANLPANFYVNLPQPISKVRPVLDTVVWRREDNKITLSADLWATDENNNPIQPLANRTYWVPLDGTPDPITGEPQGGYPDLLAALQPLVEAVLRDAIEAQGFQTIDMPVEG